MATLEHKANNNIKETFKNVGFPLAAYYVDKQFFLAILGGLTATFTVFIFLDNKLIEMNLLIIYGMLLLLACIIFGLGIIANEKRYSTIQSIQSSRLYISGGDFPLNTKLLLLKMRTSFNIQSFALVITIIAIVIYISNKDFIPTKISFYITIWLFFFSFIYTIDTCRFSMSFFESELVIDYQHHRDNHQIQEADHEPLSTDTSKGGAGL